MNVSLPPELEQFVADKVKSGRYNSASEVIREALRLLEEREQLSHLQVRELRKKSLRVSTNLTVVKVSQASKCLTNSMRNSTHLDRRS